MLHKKVTLKELAEETGYSINTVSLALKGHRVSVKTQEIVKEAAERLGYVGNANASSMRSGLTKNIAIMVGDIANPHFAKIIKEAVNLLSSKNYNAIIYNTEEREDYERNSIISALRQNVDGIMISPVKKDGENVAFLKKTNIPMVIFGGYSSDPDISSVCMDDVKAGYLATTYLISRGHTSIVFVNGPDDAQGSKERLAGYKKALEENGIPFDDRKVLSYNLRDKSMKWEETKYKVTQVLDYSALIAYNDIIALQIYTLLSGSSSPHQIAINDVVGFDNALELLPIPFKVPSVAERDIRISVAAPALLLELLQSKEHMAKKITLDVKVYNI